MKHLSELVSDWGGFEQLVATLNETGDVLVEHNVILPGRSGAPRQIDVVIKHTQGIVEHLVIVECKYRNQAVERLHVDAFATTVREVGASKGLIFSTKGFQSGAITQAKHDAIELFHVREPSEKEWGLPGRIVDLTLQFVSLSLKPADGIIILAVDGRMDAFNLELYMNRGDGESTINQVLNRDDPLYLEDLIVEAARKASHQIIRPERMVVNGSYNVQCLYKTNLNIEFRSPKLIKCKDRFFVSLAWH